ncbi:OmpA family protein [Solimonas marina]|uniref:OmpA family protein n=1 Tax=Solimonas marina TaxID=2714601 RepID=A0A969WF42_9GAMM|nr:OmpA family protein [Solimonas marina]NKF23595.1 OmpA family protein [Solimonas marina]
MKNRFAVCAGLVLSLIAGSAFAQDDAASNGIDGRFYISPMFSYSFADSSRKTDGGLGGTLAIGKELVPKLNLELSSSYTDFSAKSGSGSEKLTGVGVDVLLFPLNSVPGLYGAAGMAYGFGSSNVSDVPGAGNNGHIFNVGLGYLFGPISWLNDGSLRFDVRERFDDKFKKAETNKFADTVVSIGLLYPLGARPVKAAPPQEPVQVVAPVAPTDSDADGVPDDRDQCPNTPSGTQVNDVGCALPPPPPPCNPPLPGQHVDLAGCGVGDTITLSGVNFDFDKSTLTLNAKTILDDVAAALIAAPDIHVEVAGHTDSRGSDAYNQKLSQARAEAVMAYLGEHGVAADRMTAHGYGETEPVADNDTDEGRERNRRVELRITESANPAAPPAAQDNGSVPAPDAPTPLPEPAPAPAADDTSAPSQGF